MVDYAEELKKYFLYKNFLFEVIQKANKNFRESVENAPLLKKLVHGIKQDKEKICSQFDEMKNNIDAVSKKIDISFLQKVQREEENKNMVSGGISTELSATPNVAVSLNATDENTYKKEFISVIQQYFHIKKCLIDELLKIKEILHVKYIYIYLDDYSEMDAEAQEIFMDWFVAPLNNTSNDFVKFKIAIYPNRFYYGKLDNQKIDEINLDFYGALNSYRNIAKMEEIAVDFTRRLIKNRFKVYLPERKISDFFEVTGSELYELLFDISLNTPRILGFIFSYCYATHITMGKKITKAALNMAALKYFEEITQQYFETNRFVIKAFDELASKENLKCLVDKFVDKQLENDDIINKKRRRCYQPVIF